MGFREGRVGGAHLLDDCRRHPVEEGLCRCQLVPVAQGPADDAAQHIAAPFVGGGYAIGDEEAGAAGMVGNDLQGGAGQVLGLQQVGGAPDERLEEVYLVVVMHALQDCRQPLEAHAGVHAGLGEGGEAAVRGPVVLGEDEVPEFYVAVLLCILAAGGAAGDLRAVVPEDLRAGAAGARLPHGPEVVGVA